MFGFWVAGQVSERASPSAVIFLFLRGGITVNGINTGERMAGSGYSLALFLISILSRLIF